MLQLMLFTNDISEALTAEESGIDRILIDLEQRGKEDRQFGYHLEKNEHAVEDINLLSKHIQIPIVSRLNSFWGGTKEEVNEVIFARTSFIMIPMFKEPYEAERFLNIINNRAKTILLFETAEAVEKINDFKDFPFDEVYVGLNDLAISYNKKFAFELLMDGTVDKIREVFPEKPFGFGGLTILGHGSPLPSEDIMRELARLNSSLAILRRAFKRDTLKKNQMEEVAKMKSKYEELLNRNVNDAIADRKRINKAIMDIANSI